MYTIIRHVLTMIGSALLTWGFYRQFHSMHHVHALNRAFADAAMIVLGLTLVIGPLARLWPRRLAPTLPWRRELGIWGAVLAAVHVGIYLSSFKWEIARFFYHVTRDGQLALRRDPFAFANWVGLGAFLYAFVLALTSNDLSQRWLKVGWKHLQRKSYTMFALTAAHALGFYYLVYQPRGRMAVTFYVIVGTIGAVWLAQTAGYLYTVWRCHQRQGAAPESEHDE